MKVDNVPEVQKATPIDFSDTSFELVPEAYLDSKKPSIQAIEEAIDSLVRHIIGFLIIRGLESGMPFKETSQKALSKTIPTFELYPIAEIFDIESGEFHSTEKELDAGNTPLISCGELENGLVGLFTIPNQELVHKNEFTVAYNGSPLTTYFHPYEFLAKDDVAFCKRKEGITMETAIFAAAVLNIERWRYSYARKCFKEKLKAIKIPMPTFEGKLDQAWMKEVIQRNPYWEYIATQIKTSSDEKGKP